MDEIKKALLAMELAVEHVHNASANFTASGNIQEARRCISEIAAINERRTSLLAMLERLTPPPVEVKK